MQYVAFGAVAGTLHKTEESMQEQSGVGKQLRKMLEDQDFTGLETLQVPQMWSMLTSEERQLLGQVLVAQGERYLLQDDVRMHEALELAAQVAHDMPQILYQQAITYTLREDNPRCLANACKSFQAAVALNPDFFDAWLAWGITLFQMAELQADSLLYIDAHEKYAEAARCGKEIGRKGLFKLHWQWGLSWSASGKHSGEAHDYRMALEQYRIAAEQDVDHSDFFNDYGNAVFALGLLIGRKELLIEAVELFHRGLKNDNNHFHLWLNLGSVLERIYESDVDDTIFNSANDSFARAASIKSDNVNLWQHWGRLYANAGKFKGGLAQLQIGCEKFALANACEPNHPQVLCAWAEAQMLCGAHTEKLEQLREAEEKIIRSLELSSDNANAWEIYGSCLTELGRYFAEEAYYVQAIEKFRYGLTLNSRHVRLWYGLSLAHFALGELRNDPELIEQSAQYCSKVLELSAGSSISQFSNDWGVALMRLSEMNGDQAALESAIDKFEIAVGGKELTEQQIQACDVEWLYNYGCAYDFLGDFTGETQYHEKAVQILTQLLLYHPDYFHARYNLAQAWANLGEINDDVEAYHRAVEHFYILLNQEREDESIWNDCGTAILHLAQLTHDPMHPELSQKLYEQAEDKYLHALALGSMSAFYNLACLYSLTKNHTAAMHYLERAEVAGSLPDLDDLMHDNWLESLRETSMFRNFIATLSQRLKDKG